jgi:hypothetical protein
VTESLQPYDDLGPPAAASATPVAASAPPAAEPQIVREAFGLPLLFLTVGLAGGLRVGIATGMRFVPPPIITLILALLLLAVLVRGGGLAPERLMTARRSPLANVSGVVVLATLVFATAQMFNTLTPERGFLHLAFNLVFLILLWNTMAASPDSRHLIRSVMVVMGSAFAIKYVVLSALYDAEGGLLKRVLTTLLEGLTLGSIDFEPDAAVTGYVAFAALIAYLLGLYLLPHRERLAAPSQALVVTTDERAIDHRPL